MFLLCHIFLFLIAILAESLCILVFLFLSLSFSLTRLPWLCNVTSYLGIDHVMRKHSPPTLPKDNPQVRVKTKKLVRFDK